MVPTLLHQGETTSLTFLLPQSCCSFVSLQKRTCIPGVSTKHDIRKCSKTSYQLLHQGWIRQPHRRKRVSTRGKRLKCTTVRNPTGTVSITTITFRRPTTDPCRLHEPCLVVSMGCVLVLYLTPLAPTIPPPLGGSGGRRVEWKIWVEQREE